MKVEISTIPQNIKHIKPLDFKKIKIKSSLFKEDFIIDASLEKTIYRMVKTCLMDDGIGLAAPQIGIFKRLFIIRDFEDSNYFNCYFNPKYSPIVDSGKTSSVEGCLSVPKNYNIFRWNQIDVEYISVSNNTKLLVKERLTDYKARVFQHEFDHLNGQNIHDLFMSQNKQ